MRRASRSRKGEPMPGKKAESKTQLTQGAAQKKRPGNVPDRPSHNCRSSPHGAAKYSVKS